MLKLKLVQLDDRGNVIQFYSNATEASKCNNIKQPSISRCCNNISKMVKGETTKNNAMFSNGYCFVKLDDWNKHEEEIKWLLTKNDILCINDNGEIVKTFKTILDTFNDLASEETNPNKKVSLYRVLNDRHQLFKGLRIATREHYFEKTKENPNYYSEEYGKRHKIILYKKQNGEVEEIKEFHTLEEAAKFMNCSPNTIRYSLKYKIKLLKTDYYLKYGAKIPFHSKKQTQEV